LGIWHGGVFIDCNTAFYIVHHCSHWPACNVIVGNGSWYLC